MYVGKKATGKYMAKIGIPVVGRREGERQIRRPDVWQVLVLAPDYAFAEREER